MNEYVSLDKVAQMMRVIKSQVDNPMLKSYYKIHDIDKTILGYDLWLENHTKEIR